MNYLLDTHVLLWWFTQPKLIALRASKVIADKENDIFISCVSLWEMSMKKTLGRLVLPGNLLEIIHSVGFRILPIGPEETLAICHLPLIHHDPFDRMLVMQAKLHDLVLITRDKQIMEYPVATIKA